MRGTGGKRRTIILRSGGAALSILGQGLLREREDGDTVAMGTQSACMCKIQYDTVARPEEACQGESRNQALALYTSGGLKVVRRCT